jgi:hypothetical protein
VCTHFVVCACISSEVRVPYIKGPSLVPSDTVKKKTDNAYSFPRMKYATITRSPAPWWRVSVYTTDPSGSWRLQALPHYSCINVRNKLSLTHGSISCNVLKSIPPKSFGKLNTPDHLGARHPLSDYLVERYRVQVNPIGVCRQLAKINKNNLSKRQN